MNWYKLSQNTNKNVTFNDIVRAIDIYICENDLITSEDFQKAWQYMRGESLSKAAQWASPTSTTIPYKPPFKTSPLPPINPSKDIEKKVIQLFHQGVVKPTEISRTLNIDISVVNKVLIKYNLFSPKDRKTYFNDTFSQPIYDIIEEKRKTVGEDGSIKREIAERLGISEAQVYEICKANGWSLMQLKTERRFQTAIVINTTIEELRKEGLKVTIETVQQRFISKTGVNITTTTVTRGIAESGNKTDQQTKDPLFTSFAHFFQEQKKGGFKRFFDAYKNDTPGMLQRLNFLIDKFIDKMVDNNAPVLFDEEKGTLDLREPYDRSILTQIIYFKLQIKDIIMKRQEIGWEKNYSNLIPDKKLLTETILLLSSGMPIEEISKKTGVKENILEDLQKYYGYRNANMYEGLPPKGQKLRNKGR